MKKTSQVKKTQKQKKTSHTLLKGEGINQHTLYGDFELIEAPKQLTSLTVKKKSFLKHETPNGQHAEHMTLKVDTGEWRMGKQVEYNPVMKSITRVWD